MDKNSGNKALLKHDMFKYAEMPTKRALECAWNKFDETEIIVCLEKLNSIFICNVEPVFEQFT